MKTYYCYVVDLKDRNVLLEELDEIGLKYKCGSSVAGGVIIECVRFEVLVGSSGYEKVCILMDKYDFTYHHKGIKFTAKEFNESKYLKMSAWSHGYPMPDGNFGYIDLSYDTSDYCKWCGIGMVQNAPLRIKGEPKIGKRHMMSLEWIHDEIFVLPAVWSQIFKPLGIGCRKVLKYKIDEEIETIVQLDIPVTSCDLILDKNTDCEICSYCNRKKYTHLDFREGFYPGLNGLPEMHIFKTKEYFGSGAAANKLVYISAELYQTIKKSKLKGCGFTPVLM